MAAGAGTREQDRAALQDRAAAVRARVLPSSVIGGDVQLRRMGREQTGLCPFHTETRDGAFMVNDDKRLWHCFACGKGNDVIDYLMLRKGIPFMEALRELEADAGIQWGNARAKGLYDRSAERLRRKGMADSRRRQREAFQLWLGAAEGKGTPAQRYLENRGIDFAALGRWPGAIRYRADAPHGADRRAMPAMVTAVVLGGQFVAVHRTFLAFTSAGWVKADVERPKMVLGDFRGGSITLWKGDEPRPSLSKLEPGTPVVLAEGIEDGLSMAMAEPWAHVRAGISLDNLGNVALPPQAGDLILLCQRDGDLRAAAAAKALAAGDAEGAARHERAAEQIEAAFARAVAAQQAQAREQGSSRDVRLAWPAPGFKDFNDELRGVRMEGA